MKIIRYTFHQKVNQGTDALPDYKDFFYPTEMPYSKDNLEIAKSEAYNGEFLICDMDVQSAPTEAEDIAAMLIEHEYRLTLLELGFTESEV